MLKGQVARAAAVAITAATETQAISGIPVVGGSSGSNLDQTICGTINFLAGTAATAVTVRVKTSGGTLVGTAQLHTIAAGATANIPFTVVDQTGSPTASYQVTLQQTAATGNGTVNELVAYCLGEG